MKRIQHRFQVKRVPLFIDTEHIISTLVNADKNKFLTISCLFYFAMYLHRAVNDKRAFSNYDVGIDVSFDSLERLERRQGDRKWMSVRGNTVFMCNGEPPQVPENIKPVLQEIAAKFAAEHQA